MGDSRRRGRGHPHRRRLRSVPALYQKRSHACIAARCAAPQPGRCCAARGTAPRGDGSRNRHCESRRAAGRNAEGCDSDGRAAAARRVFRGCGRIASAGYTRRRGRDRNRSCRNPHCAHLDRRARRTACRASVRSVRRVHLDGTDLAGGHHARPVVNAGGRISNLGHAGADAARGADCHRRAHRPRALPDRARPLGRDRCHGAAPLAGRLQSRAVRAQLRRARADRLFGGDGRCRRGTGRVDARARRHVDRPWCGDRRSPDHRRARQDCRAAGRSRIRAAPPLDSRGRFRGVLRRIRKRGPVAVVSSRGRAPEVSNRRLGGVPEGEREVCRRHRRRDVRFRHRRVSSGLSPCDGGAVSAQAPAVSADRTLLAHSVAEPGSASSVPVETRSASRAARERSAGFSARARSPEFYRRRQTRNWAPRSRQTGPPFDSRDTLRRWYRCRSGWTTTGFRLWLPTSG